MRPTPEQSKILDKQEKAVEMEIKNKNNKVAMNRVRNPKVTLKRLASYLGEEKWRLAIISLSIILSLVGYVGSSSYIRVLIDKDILPYVGSVPPYVKSLMFGVCVYMVFGLLDITTLWTQNFMMAKVTRKVSWRIRENLFDKMQAMPLKFFDSHLTGELMSRFTNDMDTINIALEQSVVPLIGGVLLMVGLLVIMFISNWLLALITVGVLAVLTFVSKIIIKQSSASFVKQQQTIGNLNAYIQEMLSGQKVIKAFTYEERAEENFEKLNQEYRKASTRAQIFAGVIFPIAGNMMNISFTLTALVGGIMIVSGFGDMNVGKLGAFLLYCRMFTRPVQQFSNQINNIFAALAGAENIFRVMDVAPEIDEGTITLKEIDTGKSEIAKAEHWYWLDEQQGDQSRKIPLRGDVRFHDVTFSYDGKKTILKDMSLYAKPGQKIAFVGSTGAGKTTITNLINRFYDIQQGSITYDGIDIRDIKKDDLRHSLGMVLQDTHLFTGTIADNIRYGRLEATDEEVVAASKRASAHSFIKRLPHGYQTVITGDGGNLSQGQRQLLAIARAAVADPPVLILDEATSSIDTRTEQLIERGMDTLMEGRTVFVIAHRLSTVRNANAIIVLEQGEIVERGDHDALIAEKGRYYKLYTGQALLE